MTLALTLIIFFFFNDTATTEIYTLSLHDALPISTETSPATPVKLFTGGYPTWSPDDSKLAFYGPALHGDRKSTRLNSSHQIISYAVFCLKKKNHTCTQLTIRLRVLLLSPVPTCHR